MGNAALRHPQPEVGPVVEEEGRALEALEGLRVKTRREDGWL